MFHDGLRINWYKLVGMKQTTEQIGGSYATGLQWEVVEPDAYLCLMWSLIIL